MNQDILDILVITYNRAHYTELSLTRLLKSCDDRMRVWVWHNGTDRDTLQIVKAASTHPRFHKLYVSEENRRLREPTNWFWTNADGRYLSKVDDDCLLPETWAQTLRSAHELNPSLGVIGCWRFYDEDFVPELANRKLRQLKGNHRVMLNCWVQGSGYVMKRECVNTLGLLKPNESFTDYCVRIALKGWENGWYFPFIREEHMDDPRSPHCGIRTDEDFRAQRPLSATLDNVDTLADWTRRIRYMARSVQAASPDPRHYVGWRRMTRRLARQLRRFLGMQEPWRNAARNTKHIK